MKLHEAKKLLELDEKSALTKESVKAQFRRLALKYGPDKVREEICKNKENSDLSAEDEHKIKLANDKFREIMKAKDFLISYIDELNLSQQQGLFFLGSCVALREFIDKFISIKSYEEKLAYFNEQIMKVDGSEDLKNEITNYFLSYKFGMAIEHAFIQYENFLVEKDVPDHKNSIGFFSVHGKKGLKKAEELKDRALTGNFQKICTLLRDFYNNSFEVKGRIMPGKARANKHSFISFLMNSLKNPIYEDVVKKLKQFHAELDLSPEDFTCSQADGSRRANFNAFKGMVCH